MSERSSCREETERDVLADSPVDVVEVGSLCGHALLGATVPALSGGSDEGVEVSLIRRAAKRDRNESQIVAAFRRLGWSVEHLSGKGTPDLLVGRAGRLLLVEVKGPKGKLTGDQETWHKGWQGPPPCIVRSVDDVLAIDNGVEG